MAWAPTEYYTQDMIFQ